MTGLVAHLKQILSELVRRHRVVVWYDPGAALSGCVETAQPDGSQLHIYQGSYLALRVAAEEANPRLEQPTVLYVPHAHEEPSWLRDLELAGCCCEVDLKRLLADAFHLDLEAGLREALDGPIAAKLAASWDELLPPGDPSLADVRRALVGAALELRHRPTLEDIVLAYVGGSGAEARVARTRLPSELHSLLCTEAGWPAASADSVNRQSVAAALLLSEAAIRGGIDVDGLAKVLPRASHRGQWATWADKWRRLDMQSFESLSDQVESAYGVKARLKLKAAAAVQSFRSVDELILSEVEARVAAGDVDSVLEPARLRARSHWAQSARASGVPQPWDAVVAALEVRIAVHHAIQELRQRADWALGDLLQRFSAAEDGWWHIDNAYRCLDAHRNRLPKSLANSLGSSAARAYVDWVDALGMAVAACMRKGEWTADGWRGQGDITSEAAVKPGRTAIVLADALRFDLAMSLSERLHERRLQVTKHRSIAALPSVTEIGMAAILAGGQINAEVRDGRLSCRLDGTALLTRAERLAAFQQRFPKSTAVELSDVRQGRSIPKTETLVVYTQDIDEQGGFLPQVGTDHFDALVREIAEGVDSLVRAGYGSVVVIPDHGFLLFPEEIPPRVLPARVGADTARTRRYVVGRPPEIDGAVRTSLDALGWQSTDTVAFPMGAAVFGMPGEVPRFTHGGPTLQEAALLVVVAEGVSTAKPVKVRVIEPRLIDTVWPRFVVEGDACGELLSESRRVRLTVRSGGKVAGESEVMTVAGNARLETTVRLHDYGSSVEVSVEDFDTREVLDTKSLPVALPAGYEALEL